MKTEEAPQRIEKAMHLLVKSMRKGHDEALTAYLNLVSRMPYTTYHNALLLFMQRPYATCVETRDYWRQLGRSVNPREKALTLFSPRHTVPGAPLRLFEAADPHALDRFRIEQVYDVSQTEGEPFPESVPYRAHLKSCNAKLKSLAAQKGITIGTSRRSEDGALVTLGGHLLLRPRATPSQTFSDLVCGLAHTLQHKSIPFTSFNWEKADFDIAAAAFVVWRALGVKSDRPSINFFTKYGGDQDGLEHSLHGIHQTVSLILSALGIPA